MMGRVNKLARLAVTTEMKRLSLRMSPLKPMKPRPKLLVVPHAAAVLSRKRFSILVVFGLSLCS